MKRIAFSPLSAAGLFAVALFAGCATTATTRSSAPAPGVAAPQVQVNWDDPANFADTRSDQCRSRVKPEAWLGQLARYLENRAGRVLAGGQTLKVTITDIQRAGQCEPWRRPNLDEARIVKDVYPPRIELHFTLADAQGRVVSEGDRKLTDMAFLHRGNAVSRDDPLSFEKRLLDDWVHTEFANAR